MILKIWTDLEGNGMSCVGESPCFLYLCFCVMDLPPSPVFLAEIVGYSGVFDGCCDGFILIWVFE